MQKQYMELFRDYQEMHIQLNSVSNMAGLGGETLEQEVNRRISVINSWKMKCFVIIANIYIDQ